MKNRLITGVVLIIAALILSVIYFTKFNTDKDITYSVVVVKKDVRLGERLMESNLTTVRISDAEVASRLFQDPTELDGKIVSRDIESGSFVFIGDIIKGDLFPTIFNSLDTGKFLVSVTASSLSNSVSGQLRSGDIVRFYGINEDGIAYTPRELEYVEVADVFTDKGAPFSESESVPASIAVIVCQAQALRVVELENSGKIHFALVSRGNPEYASELLSTQDKITGGTHR